MFHFQVTGLIDDKSDGNTLSSGLSPPSSFGINRFGPTSEAVFFYSPMRNIDFARLQRLP
jgi:hypothetical protein